MGLIEDIPEPIALRHRSLCGGRDDGIVVAASADMVLAGTFGRSWLIITEDRLRVLEQADGDEAVLCHDLALTDIREPAADSLVGGGALQARVDGATLDLVRYSNAQERKFARVAKYLADLAAYHKALAGDGDGEEAPGEKPTPSAEEDDEKRCATCGLLLPEGTKVCPACLKKGKVIARLLGYLRPYRRTMLLASFLLLAGTGTGLLGPYLRRPLIDDAVLNEDIPVSQRLSLVTALVLVMLGLRALGQVLGILQGRMVVWLATRLGHQLRTEVYRHLQFHSLRFFSKHKTGSLLTRVGQDTMSLEGALIDGVPFFAANILMLLGIGTVLMVLNWKLTLLVFLPGPLVIFLSRFFWKRMFRILHRFWHVRSRMGAFVTDRITGIRVVKAFAQENQEIAQFDEYSSRMAETGLRLERFWATFFPVLSFITSLGITIVWYVGGREIVRGGKEAMTVGVLIVFIGYLHMFYGPLRFLSHISDWLARALASAERIFEILDSDPDVPEADEPVSMRRIEGHVEFLDFTFGYDAHKPVLKNISLDVKPGEMIGLVGKSGAGKSTMINLVCRFYDVQDGQIHIDGVDIRRIAQGDLRSQIGVVLQDTFLFNDTILANIRYAKPDATAEEVMRAAKAANAHEFILQKPDGYDTVVGERGAGLSGGERQRIAIARAILHNPRILILDEATSSVDTDTEKKIQDAIVRLVRGRTTFAIAHRLSTLRNADRLVVLKDGKICEVGTHDELLEKKGEFCRLVEMQREMSRITEIQR